ncbi:MAG: glycoside hydrolase family 5 protein [Candidatus Binatia bacterium]|nr:glycoside hydrolase family 5 protein [Candidatus Binatia bacterium]
MVAGRLLILAVALFAICGCGSDDEPPSSVASLPKLTARRGADAAIYDAAGRQVLLRGVNLNSLGDYYQDNPALPPVLPLSEMDFRRMAGFGFNVVRLIVSWSALEPERGRWSEAYIGRIRQAVAMAKAAGLYVVLDMHQDAWGKFIATPPGVNCGSARERAIGWDGAPEWATITDGRSTCRTPGVRELAPAVAQAFENFYSDRDGIQTAFVATWAYLAAAFAQEPAVAGYDLFNEPHWGNNIVGAGTKLTGLYSRLIPAIRAAEQAAGGFPHIIFFEPVVLWPVDGMLPDPAVMDDPHLVFAPHNYAESITGANPLSIEQVFERARADAERYQATFWIGEYGWFSDPPANKARLLRYAAEEDRYLVGGAWWQWKQACGDPHSIGIPGGTPPSLLILLRYSACPGDVDLGFVPEWIEVLSRPYPRAAPGRLLALASDPSSGELEMHGETATPGEAELWVPHRSGTLRVDGDGVGEVRKVAVPGGVRVSVAVAGSYRVRVRWAP